MLKGKIGYSYACACVSVWGEVWVPTQQQCPGHKLALDVHLTRWATLSLRFEALRSVRTKERAKMAEGDR